MQEPPFFDDLATANPPVTDIEGARVLVKVGDSITTDHISPAGSIKADSPAGRYLQEQRRAARRTSTPTASRRGNHEVMMRGTFANIRLRNELAPGTEGSVDDAPAHAASVMSDLRGAPSGTADDGVPLVVLAGQGVRERVQSATGRRRAPRCSACAS